MMAAPSPASPDPFRRYALWALLAVFTFQSIAILRLSAVQPFGVDYAAFWAGVKALSAGRAYDFAYVTALQGWPFGPGVMRPYVYPPTALFAFIPFATLPYWLGYGAWVVATYALAAWAGRRLGAPWWMVLMPLTALVAYCGQITFLVGGLAAAALTLRRRPILAGVLLGLAATLKPQVLVLLPIALAADRQWKTFAATAATGVLLGLAAVAVWGLDDWFAWLAALPRFHDEVLLTSPALLADAITPYAMLAQAGLPGALAFLLAPLAVAMVWRTFRAPTDAADRLIVLFGAALLVSPYAMPYEAALMLPGVAAYLARTDDRLWPLYATAACLYAAAPTFGASPIVAALALPASTWIRARLAQRTEQQAGGRQRAADPLA